MVAVHPEKRRFRAVRLHRKQRRPRLRPCAPFQARSELLDGRRLEQDGD
jgi:hypothetical protein